MAVRIVMKAHHHGPLKGLYRFCYQDLMAFRVRGQLHSRHLSNDIGKPTRSIHYDGCGDFTLICDNSDDSPVFSFDSGNSGVSIDFYTQATSGIGICLCYMEGIGVTIFFIESCSQ
ncbi:hypothetical protein SDC9_144548 [bioreactor metagenome]|uniref:Uncharacterized protein n=1 Tax=bioreactor metagenome TaxID=1076179 RepID=A0A645E7A9_9ZZZZ